MLPTGTACHLTGAKWTDEPVEDRRGTDDHVRGKFLLRPPALVPHRDHFLREHVPFIFTAV
jgi:hypothetical protein